MSATTNFSIKKMNTIAPEYSKDLEIVCESLRDLIEDQPFFFTLRQIPKHVSKIIAKTATKISGLTGDKIASVDNRNTDSLDFIRIPLFGYYIRCHCNAVHNVRNTYLRSHNFQSVGVNLCPYFVGL